MDAMRLIEATRCALARSQEPAAIVAEVWQSQALAQAIGHRLAVAGPPELRGEALGLSELSGRGCGLLDPPRSQAEEIRAAGLTEIGDAHDTLLGLGALLAEAGIALVSVAMGAEDEGLYWQCMESIDAADESRDRVVEMLRRLAARERTLSDESDCEKCTGTVLEG
ncbi:DUF6099 family protein [Streptomyces sp. AN091965]|uniref:DUF6099 family protein n=1 Tax=Streptomyces sp. AN091965 TaxID=2927803 RepID=UPI001F5FF7D5|nr:DUF6099 family protein [Streptomyces sp. AN091965]MCI3933598.1 DUF6099 family protein [Streptomyces sp. AN091965]